MKNPDDLSDREMEFMSFIMQQLAYKMIASKMDISYNTVKSMSRDVHIKTHTHTYAELIAYGYNTGFDFNGKYHPKS